MSGSISAPTGFFSGNVASAVIAEDLQSAIVNAESLVTTAASLAGQIITPTVNPITGSPTVTSIAGTDYVGISQATADAKITLANLLDGETIDQAAAATTVSDTDTFWVGQGSNVMVRQTQSAVWPWVQTKLASYKMPVVEITTSTTLDGSVHNGAILVVSATGITISSGPNMGSGFNCDLINVSGGNVTWSGISTSGGSTTLPTGNTATIWAATYSGGNLVFASTGQVTSTVTTPGQVTGLTAGTTTSTSQALTWSAPSGSGGLPTSYNVNYKLHSGSSWTPFASVGALSATVTGLTASTSYDYQIVAVNSAGNGTASSTLTVTTAATGTLAAPGPTTGLTAGTATANTVPLTWTAPSAGGTVADYNVQYRVTGGSSWTPASSTVTGTSYTVTGLSSSTSYDFQVAATNSTGAGPYSAPVTTTTAASGSYLITQGTQPTSNISGTHGTAIGAGLSVHDNSATHTAPTGVSLGYSTSSTTAPSSFPIALASAPNIGDGVEGWYCWGDVYPSTTGAWFPNTPGTYYLWAQAYNGATVVATNVVSPYTITST